MKKEEMVNQEWDALLMRCIDGTASVNDFQSAWEWVKESREHEQYYQHMRDIWLSAAVFQNPEQEQVEKAWERFRNKNLRILKTSGPKITRWTWLRIAAIFILAFLLGGVSFNLLSKKNLVRQSTEEYLVEAPRGAKSRVTLADGTKIWLNAGSKIKYQRAYNLNNRDVVLEGEAYFEVAKNKRIPFYVRSSGITVKALGTAFNVKAYPDEDIIETTLVEGRISIESVDVEGQKEKFVLRPNQKISFYKNKVDPTVLSSEEETDASPVKPEIGIERITLDEKINPEIYTSWKDKRWIFQKQKLNDFAVILERLYDVQIAFRDEELKNYCLTGSFDEENLDQVLKAIRLTVPIDYTIEHKNVILSLNPDLKSKYENLLKSSKIQ